jgi:hypothetical protein
MNRPCAVLSARSHELLWTLTIAEVNTVDCLIRVLWTELHGFIGSSQIKAFRGKIRNGYFPIAQTRYTLN